MPELTVTRKTRASQAACWRWLSDFGAIDAFNPALKESHLLEGSCEFGPGAERQCTMKNGRDFIHERVTDWREGEGYSIEIFNGTLPLRQVHVTLSCHAATGGATLRMVMRYQPKFGVLGRMIDPILLRPMMRGMMAKVLRGLAEKAEATPAQALAA